MKEYRFAIIGGGPAGLFAALHAALLVRELETKTHVVLYERNERPGLKLLTTGSGQCNITRNASVEHMLEHYGDNGKFLRHALHSLTPKQTMQRFIQMGLPLVTREDDKVFPASLKAGDVLKTLIERCTEAGVQLKTKERITHVEKESNSFRLYGDGQLIDTVDGLILTTGGKSFPRTGSTGDGYTLAKSLGHSIASPKPALCGIAAESPSIGACSGISVENIAISFSDSNGKRRYSHGPLLITHSGLSGPVILNTTRYLSTGDTLEVCWLPMSDGQSKKQKQIEDELLELCNANGSLQVATIVRKIGLPTNLVQWLLQEAMVDGKRKAAEVGRKTLAPLAKLLSGQRFTISLKGAFAQAMVTAGGIDLTEVDPKTMQSKVVEGLFFAGEVLDIDGDSGGYNLQAAWSTGALAGVSIVRHFT